jgi:hypothetical protein
VPAPSPFASEALGKESRMTECTESSFAIVVFFQGKPHPRISCTRHQATTAFAAFIEESRMQFINANKLHRKSGHLAILISPQ